MTSNQYALTKRILGVPPRAAFFPNIDPLGSGLPASRGNWGVNYFGWLSAHPADTPPRGLPRSRRSDQDSPSFRPTRSAALRSATLFLGRPVRFAATRMLSVRTSSSSSGVQGAKLLGKRRMRDSS